MNSKVLKLMFIFMYLLILLAFTRTFKENFISREFEYTRWKNSLKSHTADILSAKVDYNTITSNEIDKSVSEERQKYNDLLCNKYSRLYKLDSNPNMVSPRKAHLQTSYVDNTAIYDYSLKKCVHPTDSRYQNQIACPSHIECPNGGVSSTPGKKVVHNYDVVCEYECV